MEVSAPKATTLAAQQSVSQASGLKVVHATFTTCSEPQWAFAGLRFHDIPDDKGKGSVP
eukprot:SAG22_NODE_19583_length_273_cov_1.114943_1_plen_58_part_10